MIISTIDTDAEYQRAWATWRQMDYYLGIHPLKPELRIKYTAQKKAAMTKMNEREKALKP